MTCSFQRRWQSAAICATMCSTTLARWLTKKGMTRSAINVHIEKKVIVFRKWFNEKQSMARQYNHRSSNNNNVLEKRANIVCTIWKREMAMERLPLFMPRQGKSLFYINISFHSVSAHCFRSFKFEMLFLGPRKEKIRFFIAVYYAQCSLLLGVILENENAPHSILLMLPIILCCRWNDNFFLIVRTVTQPSSPSTLRW